MIRIVDKDNYFYDVIYLFIFLVSIQPCLHVGHQSILITRNDDMVRHSSNSWKMRVPGEQGFQ